MRKSKKKAFSLFEVIIVIAVSALTITGSINIIVNSSIAIKTNEIRDYAGGIALKSLELMKSSSDLLVTSQGLAALSTLGRDVYFALKEDPTGNYLLYDDPPEEDFQACTLSNIYYVPVKVAGVDKGLLMCLQIHIIPRNTLAYGNYYEIELKINYDLPQGETTETFKTFRYGSFKQR